MQGKAWGHLCFLWSHLLPVLLHPVLKQPPSASSKRKVKSFLLEKGSLLRLLLFTFGRTAIGGEFKHRKMPLLTGRAADRPGRLAAMLGVCTFSIGVQPWDPTLGTYLHIRQPNCTDCLDCSTPPFPEEY